MLRQDLQDMLNNRILMTILTDSEILFIVIINTSVTTEKFVIIYDSRGARGVSEELYIWLRLDPLFS